MLQNADGVVYRDGRYTLGQEGDTPYLIADGRRYHLTSHPYEPCLYITDEAGHMTVVHNAFEADYVLEAFRRGETITSISGFEYDARDFCDMVSYAAGMGDVNIDGAERVFGGRAKKKTVKPENAAGREAEPEAEKPELAGTAACPDDPFFRVIAEYPDAAVEYCIVRDGQPYRGYESHRRALARACRELMEAEDWICDAGKARGERIDAGTLFEAKSETGELTYRRAFLKPPYGNGYGGADFDRVNAALFPNGTGALEAYAWSTDWSDYFDDGHEWWGTLCLTVYDESLDRFAVLLASATD